MKTIYEIHFFLHMLIVTNEKSMCGLCCLCLAIAFISGAYSLLFFFFKQLQSSFVFLSLLHLLAVLIYLFCKCLFCASSVLRLVAVAVG